ncbi:MAG: hypothetical protein JO105_14715 [Hyphomicrobiales bacterium]|nr:hypothetical protein [Hyphomicrobiales bacterium]
MSWDVSSAPKRSSIYWEKEIFDARNNTLSDLSGPYGMIYSFYCIGFDWSLEHFLDDLLPLLGDDGIGIFTTTEDFKPFDRLREISLPRIISKAPYDSPCNTVMIAAEEDVFTMRAPIRPICRPVHDFAQNERKL